MLRGPPEQEWGPRGWLSARRAPQVPRQALTMGIGQILQARRVLILASGREKKAAVRRAFWGPVTPEVPASILQLHPDLTLVMDRAAAG